MSSYLPLFPLNIVAYPGEKVNLHIFEPRYRDLIADCLAENTPFGIPTVLDNALKGYGTEMEVTEIVTRYDDGSLDIRTRGLRVFRILDFENPMPDKLYAGGSVEIYPTPDEAPGVRAELIEVIAQLYKILNAPLKFDPDLPQPYSYQVAHGIGLSTEDEYELLTLETEFERQEYLLTHLSQALPVIENMERTKERIRMNGHFREFGALDL